MFEYSNHSFAVCAYKESPYLKECLKSLCLQRRRTQIIICTSTPNPKIDRLAKEFNVEVFVNEHKSNIASDWNFAIKTAPTNLVTIAHQDDVYCSNYTMHMLKAFNSFPSPQIFFSNYGEIRNDFFIDNNKLLKIKRLLISPMLKRGYANSAFKKRNILRFGSAICCPSVTYNKENIPLPLFDQGMEGGLDWRAWERLSRLSGSFCYDPSILMYHRIHKESETSRIIASKARTQEDLEILKKFWPTPFAYIINFFYSKSLKSNEIQKS